MAVVSDTLAEPRSVSRWQLSWSWISVVVAAMAMVATLPGRTHGLGLITEPLLRDLQIERVDYATLNLWATLLGATFCVPWGWLIDRLGTRLVLTATVVALGGVVVAMSRLEGAGAFLSLFVLVLLTRGLGQSALSVVSITLVGKSSGKRSGLAVGVYSFLTALGFMAAFAGVKAAYEAGGVEWRTLWAGIGLHLIALGPIAWLLLRPASERYSHPPCDGEEGVRFREPVSTGFTPAPPSPLSRPRESGEEVQSFTLRQALLSPAFWVFGLATSLYGMIASGISLFNQAILQERGFERDVFLTITTFSPLVGLASNLVTGWLASRWSHGRLTCLAMLVLTAALLAFPFVQTLVQVYLYAAAMGVAGGMITVIFFAVWGQAFGKAHLGQIQGAAQMLTVLASAVGPLLLAVCFERTGSYVPLYQYLAAASGLLAVCAYWVPTPMRSMIE